METTLNNQTPTRTFGFFGLSGLIHLGILVFITLFAGEFLQKPEMPAVTEIEIISSPKPELLAGASSPAPLPATSEAREQKPMPPPPSSHSAPVNKEEVVIKAVPAPAAQKVAQISAQSLPQKTHSTSHSTLAPISHQSQTPVRKEVAAPNFETAQLDEAPAVVTPAFDEGMIADDLAQAEQDTKKQTHAQLQALRAESEEQEKQLTKSHTEALATMEKENEEESSRMAAVAAVQQAKEKAALERATIAQAERERAAGEAAAAKARAEADAKAKAAALAATSQNEKGAGGDSGETVAGSGDGIRGIQDLKQKPGNKRPQYDNEDRFQGRQGEVVFKAYVTKDGSLTNFQILKSSGHRNLDYKTLKALKDWKFYPGQEGVVEIPFQWDLKGGPQEMPTGLRTKVSQSSRPADLRSN